MCKYTYTHIMTTCKKGGPEFAGLWQTYMGVMREEKGGRKVVTKL